MADHLSDLVLDELLSGDPAPGDARAHVASCSFCKQRMDTLTAAREDASRTSEYARVLAALRRKASEEPARLFHGSRLVGPALALACGLLVVVAWPSRKAPDERLKGAASLSVVLASDGGRVRSVRAGEKVVLFVSPAGRPWGLVMGADGSGQISQVWPPGRTGSAVLSSGAEVALEPGFEVTPGSVRLVGFFSERPLNGEAVRDALKAEAAASRAGKALDASFPGAVRAELFLNVEGE